MSYRAPGLIGVCSSEFGLATGQGVSTDSTLLCEFDRFANIDIWEKQPTTDGQVRMRCTPGRRTAGPCAAGVSLHQKSGEKRKLFQLVPV